MPNPINKQKSQYVVVELQIFRWIHCSIVFICTSSIFETHPFEARRRCYNIIVVWHRSKNFDWAPKHTLVICRRRLLMFISFGRVLDRAGLKTFVVLRVRLEFISEDYVGIFTTANTLRKNIQNEITIKNKVWK